MENNPVAEAYAKLDLAEKELKLLRIEDYVPPETLEDDGRTKTPEYEFDDAFTDPVKAFRLMVEIQQLKMETQGKPRCVIISQARAAEIIQRNSENPDAVVERSVNINVELIKKPRKELSVVTENSLVL